jgi:hypothetical protein
MADIKRTRGDTYADEFIILREETGLPLNLTGFSFLLTLDPERRPTSAANHVYQLTGTILNAAQGRVEFAPSSSQANIVGTYYYDVQMVDGAGRKRTVESGKYRYVQDITKT